MRGPQAFTAGVGLVLLNLTLQVPPEYIFIKNEDIMKEAVIPIDTVPPPPLEATTVPHAK